MADHPSEDPKIRNEIRQLWEMIKEDIFKHIIPLTPEAAVQVAGEVTREVTDQDTDQVAG
jgi:hypothetical protein